MKRTFAAFLLLSLVSGCSVKQEPPPVATSTPPAPVAATSSPQSWATPDPTPQSSDFLIIPGKSVGEIGRSSTYESLVKTYGERNVLKTKLYVGEGMEGRRPVGGSDDQDSGGKFQVAHSSGSHPRHHRERFGRLSLRLWAIRRSKVLTPCFRRSIPRCLRLRFSFRSRSNDSTRL